VIINIVMRQHLIPSRDPASLVKGVLRDHMRNTASDQVVRQRPEQNAIYSGLRAKLKL